MIEFFKAYPGVCATLITAIVAVANLWLLNWYNKRHEQIKEGEKAIASHSNRDAAEKALAAINLSKRSRKLFFRWFGVWVLGLVWSGCASGFSITSHYALTRLDAFLIATNTFFLLKFLNDIPDLYTNWKLLLINSKAQHLIYEAFRTNSIKSPKPTSSEKPVAVA